jgi:hypothetical protein
MLACSCSWHVQHHYCSLYDLYIWYLRQIPDSTTTTAVKLLLQPLSEAYGDESPTAIQAAVVTTIIAAAVATAAVSLMLAHIPVSAKLSQSCYACGCSVICQSSRAAVFCVSVGW